MLPVLKASLVNVDCLGAKETPVLVVPMVVMALTG